MKWPIYIDISLQLKIRGVMAERDIENGEVIEECPLILYEISKDEYIDKTIVGNYVFYWNEKYSCLVLGYGMLYNHSYNPNARYIRDYEKKMIIYKAIKKIKKGQEILINYNGDPRCKDKLDNSYYVFNENDQLNEN